MAYKQKSPVPIIEGGTNTQSFSHPFGVAYFDGTSLNNIDSGTATYILTSNGGASAPSFKSTSSIGTIITINADSGSVSPTLGVVTISGGSTGLTTTGSGSTMDLTGTLGVAHGGTGAVTLISNNLLVGNGTSPVNFIGYSSTTSGTSSNVVSRDANGNSWVNNLGQGVDNHVTSGGTTTLSIASGMYQIFTGTNPETIVLPDATTLPIGWSFCLTNNSTLNLTVNLNGGSAFSTNTPGSYSYITLLNNGTSAGTWGNHWMLPTSAVADNNGLTIQGQITASNSLTVQSGAVTISPFTTTGALVSNTSGVITDTNAGTAGWILTSNGPSSVPTFQASPVVLYITWNDQTTSTVTMSVNNGYVMDAGASLITATLPASALLGSTLTIQGFGLGGWTIAQNAGQTIRFGAISTTTGVSGSISSNNRYDSLTLVCVKADTDFAVMASVGNLSWA